MTTTTIRDHPLYGVAKAIYDGSKPRLDGEPQGRPFEAEPDAVRRRYLRMAEEAEKALRRRGGEG